MAEGAGDQHGSPGGGDPAPASGGEAAAPPVESLTYEQAFEELERLIDAIESGEIGLDASVRAYERGAELLARCRGELERAEQRITQLDLGDGPRGTQDA